MNRFSTYGYEALRELYPRLKSCAEFVSSECYLAKLQVKVTGKFAPSLSIPRRIDCI